MRGQVLLVVSLLAFSVVVASAPAEAGSDGGGRIAVIVGESGDVGPTPRLVIMDADGENARVLGWILDASLSPSGRVVAYESRTVTPEIWVAAADRRGGARRLVRNGRDAAWSPNGGAIAFVRGRRPGYCDHLDLWLGDLYSRTQRLLLRNARTPDWSPDGKRLAFVRDGDVWVVDLANKLARRVIRDAADPRWSPDGDRIAFVRERNSYESFVYVARADGTTQRRMAEGESVAWSPDGSELAIAEFRQVVRIRLDGTHRRVVRRGCCAFREIDWR